MMGLYRSQGKLIPSKSGGPKVGPLRLLDPTPAPFHQPEGVQRGGPLTKGGVRAGRSWTGETTWPATRIQKTRSTPWQRHRTEHPSRRDDTKTTTRSDRHRPLTTATPAPAQGERRACTRRPTSSRPLNAEGHKPHPHPRPRPRCNGHDTKSTRTDETRRQPSQTRNNNQRRHP